MSQSQSSAGNLKVSDFDFHLPEELIAQQPPTQRGASRMMIVDRSLPIADISSAHRHFADLPSLLNPGDVLVLNDSRVIPARLFGRRANARGKQEPSGQIEVLLTSPTAEGNWQALVRPGRKVRPADRLLFESPTGATILEAEVLSSGEFGARLLRFAPTQDFFAALDQIGHMPLPPYIHRDDQNA